MSLYIPFGFMQENATPTPTPTPTPTGTPTPTPTPTKTVTPTPTKTPTPTPPERTVDLQSISINGSVATFYGYVTGNGLIQKGFNVDDNPSFSGATSSNNGSASNTTWQHNFTLNGPTFYARAYAIFLGITYYSYYTGNPFACPTTPTPTPTPTGTPTNTPTPTVTPTTSEPCYGYNLTPVFDTTCDASGEPITAYKNTSGAILVNDVLRNSCGGSTLATGQYTDGTYRYTVSVGTVTNKDLCPTPEPSASPTPTPTPTGTPTPTPTGTPTPTPTPTETPEPPPAYNYYTFTPCVGGAGTDYRSITSLALNDVYAFQASPPARQCYEITSITASVNNNDLPTIYGPKTDCNDGDCVQP